MGRPSAEALLLSAMLINHDITEAARHGVALEHFRGYSNEYAWMLNYEQTYGETPSQDAFCERFPDFPFYRHENIRYAADEVLRDYAQSQLRQNIHEGVELLKAGDIEAAQAKVREYEYRRTSAVPHDLVTSLDFLDDFDAPTHGIEVPWPTVQRATGGIMPGNLWFWAARLGQGKSSFLNTIAINTMMLGKKVLYYSLEMSDAELRGRTHAALASRFGYPDITASGIRHRTVDLRSYKQFVNELKDHLPDGGVLHTHTPANGPVSPAVITSRAEEYDLVIVDYTTLMVTDAGQYASEDWRVATQISNRLKQVALATGTPILAAAQVNRDGDIGEDPPRVKNLSQSDALGQDGDVVITHRQKKQKIGAVGSIEKNRHGPDGIKFWTRFDVNHGIFDEISENTCEEMCLDADIANNR